LVWTDCDARHALLTSPQVEEIFAMRALLAIATTAAATAAACGADAQVLRVVPHSNLNILDPIWTTQYMARNHGYMVYDTLFGTDEKSRIQPQMVGSWSVSPDQRLWSFTLRPGLRFHDGAPVTGEDVIASLARWASATRWARSS
jgi:peptide/nickel transport system substrate-binding protein